MINLGLLMLKKNVGEQGYLFSLYVGQQFKNVSKVYKLPGQKGQHFEEICLIGSGGQFCQPPLCSVNSYDTGGRGGHHTATIQLKNTKYQSCSKLQV